MTAAVYIGLDLNRLCALRVGSNTGSYLQGLVNFLHTGSTFEYGDWHTQMAGHSQWIMFVMLPFVAIAAYPQTMIAGQVVALALTAPAAFILARTLGATERTAAILALVALLNPSMQGAMYTEFVALDFLPVLALLFAIAWVRGSWLWIVVTAELLCGVKEDVGLMLVWLGIIGALAMPQRRKQALAVALLATVNLAGYALFLNLEHFTSVHPSYGLIDRAPGPQLAFFLEILAPWAFAPFALRWRLLLALPLVAEITLAQGWGIVMYQTGNYYTIPIITLVMVGGIVALAKRERWTIAAGICAAVMVLFFNTTVLHFGRHLFTCDPQAPVARAWGARTVDVSFPCEDEGAWVLAARNTRAKLVGCDFAGHRDRTRAAWKDVPFASVAPWTRGPGS